MSRQGTVKFVYVKAVPTDMMYTFKQVSTRWITVDMDMEFEAEDFCSTVAEEIIGSPRTQIEQAQAADSSAFYPTVDCS